MTTLAIKIQGIETKRIKGNHHDTDASGNKARTPRIGQINIAMVDTVDFDGHMTTGAARHAGDIILRSDLYTFRTPDGVRVAHNVQAVAALLTRYNKFAVEMNTNREVMRLYDLFVLMAYMGDVFHTLDIIEPLDNCIAVNGAYSIANNPLFYEVLRDAGVIGGRDLQYSVFALVHGALRRPLNAARQHVIPGILLAHPDVRRVFDPAYVLCGEYIASRFIGVIPGVPENSPEFRRSAAGMVDRLLWKYADEVFTGDTTDTLRSFFQSRMHTVYSLVKDWLIPGQSVSIQKGTSNPKDAKAAFSGAHQSESARHTEKAIPVAGKDQVIVSGRLVAPDKGGLAQLLNTNNAPPSNNENKTTLVEDKHARAIAHIALNNAIAELEELRAAGATDTEDNQDGPVVSATLPIVGGGGNIGSGSIDIPPVWTVPEGVSTVHVHALTQEVAESPGEVPNLEVLSSRFPVTPKRKKSRVSKDQQGKGPPVGHEDTRVTTSTEDITQAHKDEDVH